MAKKVVDMYTGRITAGTCCLLQFLWRMGAIQHCSSFQEEAPGLGFSHNSHEGCQKWELKLELTGECVGGNEEATNALQFGGSNCESMMD